MAWAEGGLQGEAGGGTAQASSATHRDWGSVKFATGHVDISCIEGHNFVVEYGQGRIGWSRFCNCYILGRDEKYGHLAYK